MVSQTVEYALRAMGHLAVLRGIPATSHAIASVTHVPQGYLSKIMRALVCAELVRSFRGRRGGFVLARSAANITVLDIVNAVDPIRRINCGPMGDPLHASLCPIQHCLDDALGLMEEKFRGATLISVVDATHHTDNAERPST